MAGKYTSIYLSEALAIIDKVTNDERIYPLQTMPSVDNAQIAAIKEHNLEVAWMNEGARRLRNALVEALEKEDDDE